MQLENSFPVSAPPDRVFAFLLDINKVVGCVPGAELTEVTDDTTFKGRVKVKVGPITVAYSGTARIAERDDEARRATLTADGRETTGPGSARATATMTVQADGDGSRVAIVTEYHVAGRVAQFGRGVMEDVSRRLMSEMAGCIQSNLEAEQDASAPNTGPDTGHDTGATAERPRPPAPPQTAKAVPPQTAKAVSAFGLLWHLLKLRVARLFGRSGTSA